MNLVVDSVKGPSDVRASLARDSLNEPVIKRVLGQSVGVPMVYLVGSQNYGVTAMRVHTKVWAQNCLLMDDWVSSILVRDA